MGYIYIYYYKFINYYIYIQFLLLYIKLYLLDDHKNPTATLQCKDMNFKYIARARKIVCYRLVIFSDVLCI